MVLTDAGEDGLPGTSVFMVDYRKHLEAAKQKALAWTPEAEHVDPERMTWQMAAACIIGIFTDAMHAAECEGCAVKASAYMEIAPTEGYPHDNLPFHNVFEVDHNPGAALAKEAQEEIQFLKDQWAISREDVRRMFTVVDKQNELLTLLQSQRDAYKTRLDALMNDGLIVDKTKYRLEFADETETEVRLRLIPINHAA